MKKNLLVLLAVLGLVACGGNPGNSEGNSQVSEGGNSEVSEGGNSEVSDGGNSEVSEAASTTYTLNCSIWEVDGAWMAAYLFGGNNFEWVNMEGSSGVYTVELTSEQLTTYTNIIFCRMASGTTEANWDNRWNQTNDLLLSEGTTYSITAWGSGTNVCPGEWVTA